MKSACRALMGATAAIVLSLAIVVLKDITSLLGNASPVQPSVLIVALASPPPSAPCVTRDITYLLIVRAVCPAVRPVLPAPTVSNVIPVQEGTI